MSKEAHIFTGSLRWDLNCLPSGTIIIIHSLLYDSAGFDTTKMKLYATQITISSERDMVERNDKHTQHKCQLLVY
jgi:hypothetical protein